MPGEPLDRVAARFGLPVYRIRERVRIEGMQCNGAIFVSGTYEPRAQVTLGHEIFEHMLDRHGWAGDRERICQRGAVALLVPQTAFIRCWQRSGGDLAAVKAAWPLASWEVLATRASELLPGIGAAKWVDGRPQWRRNSPGAPSEAEREAARLAPTTGRARVAGPGHVAHSWCVSSTRSQVVAISLRLEAA